MTSNMLTLPHICGSDALVVIARSLRIRDILALNTVSRAMHTALATHLTGATVKRQCQTHVDTPPDEINTIITSIPRLNKGLIYSMQSNRYSMLATLATEGGTSRGAVYKVASTGMPIIRTCRGYIYAVDRKAKYLLLHNEHTGELRVLHTPEPIPMSKMISLLAMHTARFRTIYFPECDDLRVDIHMPACIKKAEFVPYDLVFTSIRFMKFITQTPHNHNVIDGPCCSKVHFTMRKVNRPIEMALREPDIITRIAAYAMWDIHIITMVAQG